MRDKLDHEHKWRTDGQHQNKFCAICYMSKPPGTSVSDETRTVHDPFMGKDVQISNRLVDRLRGKYAIGPHLPNGNPEFGWKQFQAPPIQHEAAKRIDALEAALREVVATETDRYACASERNAVFERARKVLEGKND